MSHMEIKEAGREGVGNLTFTAMCHSSCVSDLRRECDMVLIGFAMLVVIMYKTCPPHACEIPRRLDRVLAGIGAVVRTIMCCVCWNRSL